MPEGLGDLDSLLLGKRWLWIISKKPVKHLNAVSLKHINTVSLPFKEMCREPGGSAKFRAVPGWFRGFRCVPGGFLVLQTPRYWCDFCITLYLDQLGL